MALTIDLDPGPQFRGHPLRHPKSGVNWLAGRGPRLGFDMYSAETTVL